MAGMCWNVAWPRVKAATDSMSLSFEVMRMEGHNRFNGFQEVLFLRFGKMFLSAGQRIGWRLAEISCIGSPAKGNH